MPLRDHFHAPLTNRTSWEGLHGGWPMVIVQHLVGRLPTRYVAEPRVHSGAQVEIDVATFESDGAAPPAANSFAVETDLLDTDEYEVHVYDVERGRKLVAAVEIISPANKDRLEHRRAFVGKCEALLRKGVCVAIVDLVTSRHFNLYAELLELIDQSDPSLGSPLPAIYAAACRWIERDRKRILETWSHALKIGQLLPTLPLWLAENFSVPLELEASYEDTCRVLRIA
jgi:hypothetical protein